MRKGWDPRGPVLELTLAQWLLNLEKTALRKANWLRERKYPSSKQRAAPLCSCTCVPEEGFRFLALTWMAMSTSWATVSAYYTAISQHASQVAPNTHVNYPLVAKHIWSWCMNGQTAACRVGAKPLMVFRVELIGWCNSSGSCTVKADSVRACRGWETEEGSFVATWHRNTIICSVWWKYNG